MTSTLETLKSLPKEPPVTLEPLSLDSEFISALNHFGVQASMISPLVQQSRLAMMRTSSNKAVFTLREWEKSLEKNLDALAQSDDSDIPSVDLKPLLSHPKWGSIRTLLLSQIRLLSLTGENSEHPFSLYAPEYLMKLEAEMISFAKRETDAHQIPQHLIDQAFASRPTMAEEQRLATLACTTGNKCVMVTEGTAGAGKSFTLNAIREIYENAPPTQPGDQPGYDIIGTALSWTATKVLEASAGLSGGCAIEGLTRAMDKAAQNGEEYFKRRTILIVDEAGLVGTVHMHKLLKHAANSQYPVRVILTGDSLQLNPVMAGNALEAIVSECGSARLDTIRRQKQESHRNAVKHFCFGRAEHGLWTYWQQEAIHFCVNAEERREKVMQDYVSYCISNPHNLALVLALENKEVKILNHEIRERLKKVGRLVGPEVSIRVTDGRDAFHAPFCVGDQIVLRQNNRNHPVFKSSFSKLSEGLMAAHKHAQQKTEAASTASFSSMIHAWKHRHDETAVPDVSSLDEVDRQGIFNRMNGIILDIQAHPHESDHYILRILLAEGGETLIDTTQYRDPKTNALPLTHNFATTIYASQGQTVERVMLMDSNAMNRRLAYVGMSRHTQMCDIYADCSELNERAHLMQKKKNQMQLSEEHQANIRKKTERMIREELDPLAPKLKFKPSVYLQTMAHTWNKDSANPTAWMAKKSIQSRLESKKKGQSSGFPKLCGADNPEDHLEPRLEEPLLFSDIEHNSKIQNTSLKNTSKPVQAVPPSTHSASSVSVSTPQKMTPSTPTKGFFSRLKAALTQDYSSAPAPSVPTPQSVTDLRESTPMSVVSGSSLVDDQALDIAPLVFQDHREPKDLPSWATSSPEVMDLLHSTQGRFWGFNRYQKPRLFTLAPPQGDLPEHPICRWSFDGRLLAGDGEAPILKNEAHPQAPWLIVPDARAALLSYVHYRKKHEAHPERMPHIAIAFPAVNLHYLAAQIPSGSKAYCAWSPKDPSTLERAQTLQSTLQSLSRSTELFPKPKPAQPDLPNESAETSGSNSSIHSSQATVSVSSPKP